MVGKRLVGTLLVTSLLGGTSISMLPISKVYAAENSMETDFQTFLAHTLEGKYGNWRDGIYAGTFFNLSDSSLEMKAQLMQSVYLLDRSQIPLIIEQLKKKDQLELTDIFQIVTPGATLDKNVQKHPWLNVTTDSQTKINIDKTENIDSPIGTLTQLNNPTDTRATGYATSVSKRFTNTISTTNTNTVALGMKQTVKGGIDFLGIAEGDFSQEFSETYTYSNASQTLSSEETTISSQPLSIDLPARSNYEITMIFQQVKQSGTVTGTSNLSGGYSVSKDNIAFDLSIYKKIKVIQDLYPELWNVLKEKGIDINDNVQQVVYTGGIGFESIKGAKVIASIKDLNKGQRKLEEVIPIKSGSNTDISSQLKNTIQSTVR
ncbi:ETX/MTX2 family pore-forming toxin [Bacillus cereus]|uniref:ETX/MTX2 family pore-forming toxin n=1 Tax=Bacillus cereus TaxID=1396 RepID=UPI000C2195C3|nr:ETX/MTX2 family pore-forming toxin [Bacillus cereus]